MLWVWNMIGRAITHFLMLKYEAWKFSRLGYHVIVVDRNPEFLDEHDYEITMRRRHKKVAVLFAQSFEGCLTDLILKGFSEPHSRAAIGRRAQASHTSFTGVTYHCTHNFRSFRIRRESKTRRWTEHDHEIYQS